MKNLDEVKTDKNNIFEENSISQKESEVVIYDDRIILEDGAPELSETPTASFNGGRYRGRKLLEDKIYYRAGEEGKPLGQYFSEEAPQGVVQVRIDKAVLPIWPSGDKSIINMAYKIKIPAGTFIYEDEIASQGGFYWSQK